MTVRPDVLPARPFLRAPLFLSIVAALPGCGGGGAATSGPPPERGTLAAGLVARAGREEVTADSVGRIALAQGVDPQLARERAIRDALFAAEARASGVDVSPDVERSVKTVLARRLLQQLLASADAEGPITDEELRLATARRWLELDRPEGFRTVHAVVRVPEGADAATRARAEQIARAIRSDVVSASAIARERAAPPPVRPGDADGDPAVEEFRRAAGAGTREGLEVLVEALPAVAADGRMLLMEGGSLDDGFARAASSLGVRGDLSEVVTTSYGAHVILLLERTPASIVPAEERRRRVRDEVLWSRASAARAALLQGLRRDVVVERSADALLVQVPSER
ncbi:peptidylprolyl isomerase [Polyangium aurulentum]|uniref:peptidylprolyl isomerase n=1 Tax=Polyangium aurulentum TaxID=2567896 RepID=UPI0010ADA8BA|nr:peptidylprolyl isomerase [Polyangium aurulentum]UQA59263.1 peptidylprolyl isomerase [Polyangium aurulentum]